MRHNQVILIEDDEDDAEIIIAALQVADVTNVVHFDNPATALKHFQQASAHPFLVICDVNLPSMDGFELKQQIDLQARPDSKPIPFIFLSTAAGPLQLARASKVGSQGYFQKPSDYKTFNAVVFAIVDYWKLSAYTN